MASPTLKGRTIEYKTEDNGDVKAFLTQDAVAATNPCAIFVKEGEASTYISKSRVTDEEYTISAHKNLADTKTALENFLIKQGLYEAPEPEEEGGGGV